MVNSYLVEHIAIQRSGRRSRRLFDEGEYLQRVIMSRYSKEEEEEEGEGEEEEERRRRRKKKRGRRRRRRERNVTANVLPVA